MSEDGPISWLSRRSAIATAVLGTLLLAGSALAVRGDGGPAHTAAGNLVRAQASARELLAAVALPAGARAAATLPAGTAAALAPPTQTAGAKQRIEAGQQIDAHAVWIVPGTPSTVLGVVAARAPAQSTLSALTAGSGGLLSEEFSLPAISDVLSKRQLVVSAVPLPGDRSALRADGETAWIVPRPAWYRVPAGVAAIVVTQSVDGAVSSTRATRVPWAIRAIVRAVNRRAMFPSGALTCPAGLDRFVRLSFLSAAGAALAAAVESPTGCATMVLTIAGRAGPVLADDPTVTSLLAGLRLLPAARP
jgi:hypothetical protein